MFKAVAWDLIAANEKEVVRFEARPSEKHDRFRHETPVLCDQFIVDGDGAWSLAGQMELSTPLELTVG